MNLNHKKLSGRCFTADNTGYLFVPIPKNASTFSESLLIDRFNWKTYNFNKTVSLKRKKPIIILRDPIDRWISGIVEFMFRNELLDNWKDLKLFEKIVFDEHTEKQTFFLENLNLSNAICIKFSKKLESNLCKFLTYNVGLCKNTNMYPFFNQQTKDKILCKKEIKTYLQNNPKYVKVLEDFYASDIKLITDIKIWNPPTNVI